MYFSLWIDVMGEVNQDIFVTLWPTFLCSVLHPAKSFRSSVYKGLDRLSIISGNMYYYYVQRAFYNNMVC